MTALVRLEKGLLRVPTSLAVAALRLQRLIRSSKLTVFILMFVAFDSL